MLEQDVTPLAWKIELLLMDVDGVLTDGTLLYLPLADGRVVETGAAIGIARRAGIKTGIISGRASPAVARRAEELKMDFSYQGLGCAKLPAFEEILGKTGIVAGRVCYVGDDIQDLPILTRVGFPVAVPNACSEVLTRAAYVTRAHGGHGAIREVIELILRAQGKWEATMSEFLS